MTAPKLVIGGNGFLGSHVVRHLVDEATDAEIRVTVRATANTAGIDDLDVTRFVGDIFDLDVIRAAMTGCDVVYYCVVDARAWLRDPSPLFRTNVDGLRGVLEVAAEFAAAGTLKKFVFTSSYSTVGRKKGRVATEDDLIDRRKLTAYVRSRVQAEDLVLQYARDRGVPAVAMCVSTTYGGRDHGMTPQGAVVAGTVFEKLPFVLDKIALEAVGVEDAARAMVLAADRGRPGQRYLISERMISNREVIRIAADEAGVSAPRRAIPVPLLYAMGAMGSVRARLTGTDQQLTLESVRLMRAEAEVDCAKARRELDWTPRPVEESIRAAARFWAQMRSARRQARAAS
ncbi:NAD-dependent epimerase/dehydratase family protein [[Mycobacterium] wendilense]|uniref:NAD-dependent epimerase/dehydratase family protein n=1 Tax=[Mycobacterium] wendilense TaxID=3064284 RepID=A0ABN9P452_9MYCO|nr:NAD-dependent epimerase/dehydratase family protein [Mycolicibacterium sp. MU0050]CAJ1586610.1 NAD-dependent epimerase/dehydratase family protein [Mycolicibacterium sp. MU0050]